MPDAEPRRVRARADGAPLSAPLRLLQLVHGYPPAVGGVERSTRDLCEALVGEHGFEVTVLTTNAYTVSRFHDASQPTIPIREGEVQNGVRVLRFPADTRWSRVLRQSQRLAWRLRAPGNDRLRTWYNGPRSPELLAAVRTIGADVICAAAFPLNHMRYPFLRPEPRPPVVLVGAVHTQDAWGFDRPYLLRCTSLAHATVAHTAHEAEWLVQHGTPADRIRVIGHGLDLPAFRPRAGAFRARYAVPADAYLVAFVGQQARHKGIDTLLLALPALLDRQPSVRLVIGGARTSFSDDLEGLIATLPDAVARRVHLISDLSEQEKVDLLGDADVLASPSRAESFGITTLEAWAVRTPVVVADSPAQREIVDHGETGLLVPYGDAASLAAALDRLGDPILRRALGAAGHARLVARFRHEQVVDAYAELFLEAAAGAPRAARTPA